METHQPTDDAQPSTVPATSPVVAPAPGLEGRTFCLCLGAQKAGTTWLHRYLQAHPDCFLPTIKEMQFFNELYEPEQCAWLAERHYRRLEEMRGRIAAGHAVAANVDEIMRDLEARSAMRGNPALYFDFFARHIGDRRLFADITPDYSVLNAEQMSRIARLHDDTRVLFIMRDPVDRFWSSARMKETRRDRDKPAYHYGWKMLGQKGELRRGRYDIILEDIKAAFPGRHLVLFYETLFREETVAKICAFLGLRWHAPDFSQRVNVSKDVTAFPENLKARVYEKHRAVYDYLEREGYDMPRNWLAKMDRFR